MAKSHDFFLSLNPLLTRLMRNTAFIILFLIGITAVCSSLESSYSVARKFIETEDWDSAIFYSKKCLEQAQEDGNTDYQIKSNFAIGYSYAEKRDFGNSIISYLNAAELAEFSDRDEHKKLLISLYKNISLIVFKYKHYDLTKAYINKSLKIAEAKRDTFQILNNTHNLINLLIEEGKTEEAASLIRSILIHPGLYPSLRSHLINSLGRIEHDMGRYDEARKLYSIVIDSLDVRKAVAQLNYAWTFYDEMNYPRALEEFRETFQYCTENSNNNWLFLSHKMLAKCFLKENNFDSARKHFLIASELLEKPEVERQGYLVYNDLSELYALNGNEHKALDYKTLYSSELEKHIEEQEEILIQDKKYNMQLLTDRYFDNLKAREIEEQAAINTRNIIVVSIVLLLLFSLGFYYRQRRIKLAIVKALTSIELNSKV